MFTARRSIAVAVVSGSDIQATALSGASLVDESRCTGDGCGVKTKRGMMCRRMVV
jgi:hypothetical protein